jgi:hypothetical protein
MYVFFIAKCPHFLAVARNSLKGRTTSGVLEDRTENGGISGPNRSLLMGLLMGFKNHILTISIHGFWDIIPKKKQTKP